MWRVRGYRERGWSLRCGFTLLERKYGSVNVRRHVANRLLSPETSGNALASHRALPMDLADLLESTLARRVELVTREALSPFIGPRVLADAEDILRAEVAPHL